MNFNKHSDVEGEHSFLSPSKYHWVNYDLEKLIGVYNRSLAVKRGNELHDFARRCINLGIKLPKSRNSLHQFVNDALGFRMAPEQILFYSYNAFGTVDAISIRDKKLRIHDLKTGQGVSAMTQLEIYAALFCLEYEQSPSKLDVELRIYQFGDIVVHIPEPIVIREIMDKIILFDKKIEEIKLVEETWRA